jgi:hypothetical protein
VRPGRVRPSEFAWEGTGIVGLAWESHATSIESRQTTRKIGKSALAVLELPRRAAAQLAAG